jgi:hypothetical protein
MVYAVMLSEAKHLDAVALYIGEMLHFVQHDIDARWFTPSC